MIDGLVQRVRWYEDESRRKGTMTFAKASLIAKALHPDSTSSPRDREEAFKAFSAWKADRDAVRRKAG